MIRFYFEFDADCTVFNKLKHFNYAVGPVTLKPSNIGPIMPLDITIKTTEQILVTLTPTGSDGKPFVLISPPSWTVTAGIATLVVAPDGLSAQLVSSDSPGDSLITIKDTSPGGTLTDSVTLHCDLAPPPTVVLAAFGIIAGTPTAKGTIPTIPTVKTSLVGPRA